MKIRIIALVSILVFPNFLYATTGPLGSLVDLANTLAGDVVTSLGYLMFTLAVVAFFAGIVKFIWAIRNGDSGKEVENGKQFMLWGLIALFVMFSVWGIIKFTQGIFNIQGQTSIIIPNIQLLGSPTVTPQTGVTNTTLAGEGAACSDTSNCISGLTCVGGNISNKVCTNTSKAENSPCIQTVCSNANNPASCIDKAGKYNAQLICVPTDTSSNTSTPDPFCLAYGKDAECTVNNGPGFCDNTYKCRPKDSQTGNFCRTTTGLSGKYDSSNPPKCIAI